MNCTYLLLFPLTLLFTAAAHAFGGGLPDPFDWYGGNDYGHYDAPYGGYGSGYPGPGGYGQGYPGPGGYGYPGYSAYGPPPGAQTAEIERLKARIRKLEQAAQQGTSTFGNTGQGLHRQLEHQWPAPHIGIRPDYPGVAQPAPRQSAEPVYQPDYGIPPRYRFQ